MSFLVSCKTAFWTINLNKFGNERKIRPLGNVEGNIIQIENYSKDILIILFYKNLIIWKTNKILKQIESAEDNGFEYFNKNNNYLFTFQHREGYNPITSIINLDTMTLLYSMSEILLFNSNIINQNYFIGHDVTSSYEPYDVISIETGKIICEISIPFNNILFSRDGFTPCIKLDNGFIIIMNNRNIFLLDLV